ncbi:hypothetical protein BJ508DRAFT_335879 [Ascobolus immersus RN42]|uniref:C2H2-type domain-containing protein n=1 Tax=Ascobolus immersus RN42 TaxID=1160509 RepID=A0A3N4HD60_ASCIM|nr:hypothetical protein BJ508DRAFT_335879 [Ascobolus immersus RN42]
MLDLLCVPDEAGEILCALDLERVDESRRGKTENPFTSTARPRPVDTDDRNVYTIKAYFQSGAEFMRRHCLPAVNPSVKDIEEAEAYLSVYEYLEHKLCSLLKEGDIKYIARLEVPNCRIIQDKWHGSQKCCIVVTLYGGKIVLGHSSLFGTFADETTRVRARDIVNDIIIPWLDRQRKEQIKEAWGRIKQSLIEEANGGRIPTLDTGDRNTVGLPPFSSLVAGHSDFPPAQPPYVAHGAQHHIPAMSQQSNPDPKLRYPLPNAPNHQGNQAPPPTPAHIQQQNPVPQMFQQNTPVWQPQFTQPQPQAPHPSYPAARIPNYHVNHGMQPTPDHTAPFPTVGGWNVEPGRKHPRYPGPALAPGPVYLPMQQPQQQTSNQRVQPQTGGLVGPQPLHWQSAGNPAQQYTCNEISKSDYYAVCGQKFSSAVLLEEHKRGHYGFWNIKR